MEETSLEMSNLRLLSSCALSIYHTVRFAFLSVSGDLRWVIVKKQEALDVVPVFLLI